MKPTSLVIDDNRARADELNALLKFLGDWDVVLARTHDWREHVGDTRGLKAVFVGDNGLGDGLEAVVHQIRETAADLPVVLVDDRPAGGSLSPGVAEACCARLTRPFRQPELTQVLKDVNEWGQRGRRRRVRGSPELFRCLSGESAAVNRVRELIQQVAPSEATVLILGASGTGKEVVARHVHYHSGRREGTFVPVNCGAIPGELLESELFGHERGAFTGAITARQGRFELAQGGTLFLDEVGDMPLPMQVKLLRVLQERTFERVGSNKSMRADVRIVAATHRNLEQAIEAGKFREDLYYRLNVFPIEVPSLKERIEDMPALVEDLFARIEHEHDVKMSLSEAALDCLCRYTWPGNVRELANLMERLAILYPGRVIEARDLPAKFRGVESAAEPVPAPIEAVAPPPALGEPVTPAPAADTPLNVPPEGIDLKDYLADIEYRYIQAALDQCDGVVARAATLLKMRRTTLVEKMRKYGIKRDGDTTDI